MTVAPLLATRCAHTALLPRATRPAGGGAQPHHNGLHPCYRPTGHLPQVPGTRYSSDTSDLRHRQPKPTNDKTVKPVCDPTGYRRTRGVQQMPGRRRSASVTPNGTPTVARSQTALSSETLLLASPSASAAVRQRPVHQLSRHRP
eukprot:scaffold4485_cov135-Isochrysis_galbana.AAC.3